MKVEVGMRGFRKRHEHDTNPDDSDWGTVSSIIDSEWFNVDFDDGMRGYRFNWEGFGFARPMIRPLLHHSDPDYRVMMPVDPLASKPKPYVPRHRLEAHHP